MRFRPEPAYQKIVISLKPDRLKANRAPKLTWHYPCFFSAFCIKYVRVTTHFTKNEMKRISKMHKDFGAALVSLIRGYHEKN